MGGRGESEREIGEKRSRRPCGMPSRCRVAKRVIAKHGQSVRETNDKTTAQLGTLKITTTFEGEFHSHNMEEIKYENVHHSTNIPPMKLNKQRRKLKFIQKDL